MRTLIAALALLATGLSGTALAADLPVKAPPRAATMSWTGFYLGGQIGGGWASRDVTYSGNDPVSNELVNGLLFFPGDQPLVPNSFRTSGVVGGVEAGYNWQVGRQWLWGVEADFSASGMRGEGSSTSFLQTTAPGFPQTVSEQQAIDWYGTVRARLGWLPTDTLLLFATGGFAYGQTRDSATYAIGGPAVGIAARTTAGFSFSCTVGGFTCFSGSSSAVKAGWTLGGGGEWMFAPSWSAKLEYQYVNLGNDAVTLTALATSAAFPGRTPSSFNANLGRNDFHVARFGVNYHF
jgi:outer membrane immunogenic protein